MNTIEFFLAITFETARALLESAESAWAAGSVEGVLNKYADDVVYQTNTGGPNGEILIIHGKEELRERLEAAMSLVESRTRMESFRYEDGIARVRLSADIHHRKTGHTLTCSVRQVIKFRGFKIAHQQDIQDAAKLAAFWKLVGERIAPPRDRAET